MSVRKGLRPARSRTHLVVGRYQGRKGGHLLQRRKLIEPRELQRRDEHSQSLSTEAQRLALNVRDILEMLQETRRRLCHNVQHPHSRLEVLDETLEEGDKVFRSSDVARDRLFQQVVWQNGIGHEGFRLAVSRRLLEALYELRVLVLQLGGVRLLNFVDTLG